MKNDKVLQKKFPSALSLVLLTYISTKVSLIKYIGLIYFLLFTIFPAIWVDRIQTMITGKRKFQVLADEFQTNRLV